MRHETLFTHALTTPLYGRATSQTVTARLSQEQRSQVLRCAAAYKLSPGAFARRAILKMAAGGDDPEQIVADLLKALGLPDTATSETIVQALQALLSELDADKKPSDRDPLRESPDSPPRALSDRQRHLTAPGGGGRVAPAGDYQPTPAEREQMHSMNATQQAYFLALRAGRAREAAASVERRKAEKSRIKNFDAHARKMR